MTTPFITQCPNCGTAFEVSERELSMADGIVRCGQCRHVFTATDFPVDAHAVTRAAPAHTDELPDFARHDDTGIEDLNDNLRFTVREAPKPEDTEPPEDAVFDDDTGVEEIQAQLAEQKQFRFSDAFVKSTEEDSHAFSNESTAQTDTITPAATAADETPETPAEENEEAGEDADVRPFILDDLGDEDDESASAGPATASDTLTDMPPVRDEDDTRDDLPVVTADHLDEAFDALEEDAPATAAPAEDMVLVAGTPLATEPLHSKLGRLGGTPIEMPIHDARPWLRREGLWLAAAGLALLALLVQYTGYQFDRLAHDPHFRGPLTTACKLVGCSVPPEIDSRQLQATNLVVRSHPALRNVLAIDFILTNDAVFNQPFPDLLLQFADVNGNPLAQRRLRPADYLAGEMAGARLLPGRQSVHVALEVLDPGQAAVAYALQPLPADTPASE